MPRFQLHKKFFSLQLSCVTISKGKKVRFGLVEPTILQVQRRECWLKRITELEKSAKNYWQTEGKVQQQSQQLNKR